jgi:hypothetical protein
MSKLGESPRLAVVGLTARGIEPVGMRRDVAEQVPSVGREPGLRRRGFDRASAQALRLVESAEQKSRAAQRVVGRPDKADDSMRRETLEEPLPFPEPEVPRPKHRDRALDM